MKWVDFLEEEAWRPPPILDHIGVEPAYAGKGSMVNGNGFAPPAVGCGLYRGPTAYIGFVHIGYGVHTGSGYGYGPGIHYNRYVGDGGPPRYDITD